RAIAFGEQRPLPGFMLRARHGRHAHGRRTAGHVGDGAAYDDDALDARAYRRRATGRSHRANTADRAREISRLSRGGARRLRAVPRQRSATTVPFYELAQRGGG